MRFASLILAFAFLCAGASLAGSADGGLPIGSFVFNGASAGAAPGALVMASMR